MEGVMRRHAIAVALLAVLVAAAPASARPHGDRIPRGADKRAHRHRAIARAAAGAVTSQLADGWCGAPTPSSDDVVDQAAAGTAIKVVYAHPSDVGDNFATYAPVIQDAAKAVQNAFLDATGGARTVRFDVGTSCGANYVDIQDVALPRTADQY